MHCLSNKSTLYLFFKAIYNVIISMIIFSKKNRKKKNNKWGKVLKYYVFNEYKFLF